MSDQQSRSPLDRQIPVPGWFGLSAIAILIIAAFVRLFRLDNYLLNLREASWAYDAWSMYFGRPLPAGQDLPDSAPFMLVWNALSFFLFGVTDATARVGSAMIGIALVGVVLLLRPFLTRAQVLSMAAILAVSPTVVFASRTIEPGIAIAFFAVLAISALLRFGISPEGHHGWAMVLGLALAGLYASGPLGVTTILALGLGILAASLIEIPGKRSAGAIGIAIKRIGTDRQAIVWLLGSLIFGLVALFSRAFSSFSSLTGLGTTLSDWGSMMFSGSSTVPAMFYFWSLMLYETVAVAIAVATAALSRSEVMRSGQADRQISSLLFVVWFAAALFMHTASSTRDAGSTVLVVLPVLLLAGSGLGRLLEMPRGNASIRSVGAAVASLVLMVYSLNAMTGLAFTRGESGSEPLAHDVPSMETRDFLGQVMRLSRDFSVTDMNHLDPTGRFGLTIQVTPQYEWPFTWYFRDFPNYSVAPAASFSADTDVAIASNPEAMESAELESFPLAWIEKPGDPLTMMRSGDIIRTGINPANWGDAWNYMINREAERNDNPRILTVGYSSRIIDKMRVAEGPFNLFDGSAPGPGIGVGQLNQPTGVATAPDGTIYVVNMMNARIEIYDHEGNYTDAWNWQQDPQFNLGWSGTQGATEITVGPDGLIYIADTWNHAVLAVSPEGSIERIIGDRGVQTDIGDEADPLSSPGLFFGPRGIAFASGRIYITDTGNERVQIFDENGTFVHAFGGFGDADGLFVEPTGIAVGPDGTIWVADSGNARLQVFDAEGNWLASHRVPAWAEQLGVDRINLLEIDANGVLYFTTPSQGVWAWSVDNEAIQVDAEYAQIDQQADTASDEMWTLRPGGIALDTDGNLLVTRVNAGKVDKITPELPGDFIQSESRPSATPDATPTD